MYGKLKCTLMSFILKLAYNVFKYICNYTFTMTQWDCNSVHLTYINFNKNIHFYVHFRMSHKIILDGNTKVCIKNLRINHLSRINILADKKKCA